MKNPVRMKNDLKIHFNSLTFLLADFFYLINSTTFDIRFPKYLIGLTMNLFSIFKTQNVQLVK